jgi:phenylpropionate dioxygenase-like ring-hydroxylating dioxygenase large terminal subunit
LNKVSALSSPLLPRGCTFLEEDWRILARHWYPVALLRDLEETPLLQAKLLDSPLVIYRAGSEIVVADDLCPHRGVPLSMGKNDDCRGVTCAYHGLRFAEEGRCVHVPAHPRNGIPTKLHLKTYPAGIRYGLIWTCLDPQPTSEPDLPLMPHWDEVGFQQINCPLIDIFGFAGRQMEGFLDVAHFGFVHTGTFGDPDNVEVPPYETEPHPRGFYANYWSTVSNFPRGIDGNVPPGFIWLRRFSVHLPFVASLVVHFPGDGRLSILNAASPVSARLTRLFVPIARNFDTDIPVQTVYDFNRRVFEEDKAIVEMQRPENLPLDPRLEAHIPADRSSIAYRRGLRDLGLSHFFIA